MAQIDKVYQYMEAHGEITQREAIYLGCYRLAAVIFNLKKQGVPIRTEMRLVKKADGTVTHIAVYSIATEDEPDV